MTASSRPRYQFDSDVALKQLDDRITIAKEEHDYENEDDDYEPYPIDAVKELREIIAGCSTVESFQHEINQLDLYQFGSEFYEWLPELGSVISGEVRAYLIGLKMASLQLGSENKE